MVAERAASICLSIVLTCFNFTLATPPWLPDAESPTSLSGESIHDLDFNPDLFEGLTPLQVEPAKQRGLAEDFSDELLNQHSPPLDPHSHILDEWVKKVRSGVFDTSSSGSRSAPPPSVKSTVDNGSVKKVPAVHLEQHTIQVEKSNPILGEHSRDQPITAENEQSAQVALGKHPRDEPTFISAAYQVGQMKLSDQSRGDAEVVRRCVALIEQALKGIALDIHTYPSIEMPKLRIVRVRTRSSVEAIDQVQIRLKKGNGMASKRDLSRRILALLKALNVYHNMAVLSGLDQLMMGVNESAHQNLIEWFFCILFEGTTHSWPLLGRFRTFYPPPNPELLFEKKPQQFLIKILTNEEPITKESAFTAAIKLIGYWYKDRVSEIVRLDAIARPANPHPPPPFNKKFFRREYEKAIRQNFPLDVNLKTSWQSKLFF
ncbi:hypothetical protein PSHT_01520 [Puccinia striiformis]|uniref:Uncharacterized protein n=1 Tax=Puccinia striiformis TaxID=27350 RepID=A0A2S4WKA7_9BASI|nr:hypothetical protein PSHT_01520 [Puccinia striiformis]